MGDGQLAAAKEKRGDPLLGGADIGESGKAALKAGGVV
jgi:hypothetical protein